MLAAMENEVVQAPIDAFPDDGGHLDDFRTGAQDYRDQVSVPPGRSRGRSIAPGVPRRGPLLTSPFLHRHNVPRFRDVMIPLSIYTCAKAPQPQWILSYALMVPSATILQVKFFSMYWLRPFDLGALKAPTKASMMLSTLVGST